MPLSDLFQEESADTKTARMILDGIVGAKNTLRGAWGNANALIWQNPYGLTPQQVFDALGTKAGLLLALSQQIVPLLEAADAEELPVLRPEGVVITVNQDGTVTLS